MRWAENRVGPDRIKGAYAWNPFKNSARVSPSALTMTLK